MQRVFLIISLIIVLTSKLFAQDTIVLTGQPNWQIGLDIADHCLFYEDGADKPLSFGEVKEKQFIPYKKEFRQQKASARPLVVQWFKFRLQNNSKTDTLELELFLTAHYFTRIYKNDKLVSVGGAYEESASVSKIEDLPIKLAPLTNAIFWARTEDRLSQLVPPYLILETPYVSMKRESTGRFGDRYLFMLMAITTGCLLFISVFAAYQYYLYRDRAFIWYIAYTAISFLIGLFWMDIRNGLRLFPGLFHDFMLAIFIFLVPLLYTLFIGSMLQLPTNFKKGWLLVKVLLTVITCQMLIEFVTIRTGWFMFNYNYYGYFLSIIPLVVLHVVLLILTGFSKSPVKWFLFMGLMSLLLLWCLPLTYVFALIPTKSQELFVILIFPPAFLLVGLTIEAVCFAFALSYRSKLVLIEKNKMQQYHAKDLQEKLTERTFELVQQRNIREEENLLQVATAFEKKIAETEMTALRAQMNPHFIFNCLNSIKLYTLENDSQTASEYLTIFSQLIRLVLENSRSEKVTLQKELETLRLYIELEAMRFKDKVNYQINVTPEVDLQYIEIPPLLLQPYVENAIWHGLMHKKTGGNLSVNVSQPAENCLVIEITDDGVGRELAAEYKSKSATRQKSFGLKMTSERIEIINQLYKIEADVRIIDLKDGKNRPTGTKVIIKLPI
jgi:sensor histidine kinase YesM